MAARALIWRDYRNEDRKECLRLFDGNMPDYFAPSEREGFEQFLDKLPGPYWVLMDTGKAVGCGGYATGVDASRATLCWGMVERSVHRRGLGQLLLAIRVVDVAEHTKATKVELSTEVQSHTFFARFGFAVTHIARDGYGPGKDSYDMEAPLDTQLVVRMRAILSEAGVASTH